MESGVWKRRRTTKKQENHSRTRTVEEEERKNNNKKTVWTEYGSWDHSVTIFDLYEKYKSDIYIFKPADFFDFFFFLVAQFVHQAGQKELLLVWIFSP